MAATALFTLGSFGLGWVVTWLGVTIGLRRLRGSAREPWVERARQVYPARRLVVVNMILLPLALFECVLLGGAFDPRQGMNSTPRAALSGLAAFIGAMLVGRRLECRLCRKSDGPPPKGVPLSWLLYSPVLLASGLTLANLPDRWGWPAAGVLAFGAALTTFNTCGGWLTVLRRFGLAGPASPR
ncbi:MAG: hypothetical protein LC749_03730, partial [Actinobacteria bacterium]|nr:hypothetical protein [Actinomycetota bacterium]